MRAGKWKLLRLAGEGTFLFDLESAAGETENLAGDHPEVVARLEAKLAAWAAEQTPPGLPSKMDRAELQTYASYLHFDWRLRSEPRTVDAAQGNETRPAAPGPTP